MVNNLPSVMEREEPHSPNATRTPINRTVQRTPNASNKKQSVDAKTPTSVSSVRPTLNEMHPSKVHHSTTKQADSGLILGFNPVKRDANGQVVKDTVIHNTPTKSNASPSNQFGTPGYEFKFSCQESQLSDEARKLMESVRGEVVKIRDQMVQDKGKQIKAEEESEGFHGGRKFAKPRGKSGRFSDAHMAEFKKMDSIAGHASAFRATPGRFQPVAKSLKRSNSKTHLDEPNEHVSPSKSPVKRSPILAAGTKRVKRDQTDDISTRRPLSKDDDVAKPVTKPVTPRPRHTVRSSLLTPTKASAARMSASVRPPKKSKIPSLTQSPAKAAQSPHVPRTEFNPRFKSHLPTFSGLKSILRRHQPLFSKDPTKIAAGTHIAAADFSSDMLLTGRDGDPNTPSPKKHVEFSASTKSQHELTEASPSPSKIPVQARFEPDISYPTLPPLTPEKESTPVSKTTSAKLPSIRQVRSSDIGDQPPVGIPSVSEIPSVPHGIGNKKRRREETDDETGSENVPPEPAERSVKRVKVGTPAKHPTPSPIKPRSTPHQATPGRRIGTPASAKKRNVLSISRLNMLAKPRNRT